MKFALIPAFLTLVALLVVGQRFGFTWAGGDGYLPEIGAYADDGAHYARGETVSTGQDERVSLRVGVPGDIGALADLWIDQNTSLTLEQTNANGVIVKIGRGRMLAVTHDPERPLTIKTGFTQSSILRGSVSVVNYDFRETVSVIPVGSTVTIGLPDGQSFETQKPVDIHETPPVSISEFAFDPSSGAAAEFYNWAIE